MTLLEAKEYLLANACCDLGNKCSLCPFYDSTNCLDVRDDNLLEVAIEVIYKEVKYELGR